MTSIQSQSNKAIAGTREPSIRADCNEPVPFVCIEMPLKDESSSNSAGTNKTRAPRRRRANRRSETKRDNMYGPLESHPFFDGTFVIKDGCVTFSEAPKKRASKRSRAEQQDNIYGPFSGESHPCFDGTFMVKENCVHLFNDECSSLCTSPTQSKAERRSSKSKTKSACCA